jgi:hypothetical protein
MEKFIPKEKLSKKAHNQLNKARRGTWGSLNPITRKAENKKAYNRQKVQRESESYFPVEPFDLYKYGFLILCLRYRITVLYSVQTEQSAHHRIQRNL